VRPAEMFSAVSIQLVIFNRNVEPVPIHSGHPDFERVAIAGLNHALQLSRFSGLQTRWAHRLQVYVPIIPSSFDIRASSLSHLSFVSIRVY